MKGGSDDMGAMRMKQKCSSSIRREIIFGITIAVASLLLYPCLASAQGSTIYAYDQLGRVIGVISPTGDAAAYTYDPTGNITSILRYTSTQVSIVALTPENGSVDSTVTVYGTGFSTTATQNVVKFNGTQASVLSSTSNTIVTEVPAGATTGPVSVATPTGSASSKTAFTVAASLLPTISGFTPTIAAVGTAVSVNGTNFQPTVTSDTVRMNGTLAKVGTATSTQINTSVAAGATSGPISVVTPFGQATSTADFFAVPSPYTASEVAFTGRMSVGQTSTLDFGTAGEVGLLLFDEISGHRATLISNDNTFANCELTLSILSPSNVNFTSDNVQELCTTDVGFLSTPVLTETGTYTIFAQVSTAEIGSTPLTLYDIPHDFSSAITPDGSPVNVNLAIPGQMARLTFPGTAGQNVSVNFANGTFVECTLNLVILNPDGSTLDSTLCVDPSDLISQQILPLTGNYTILLTPTGPSTGGITVAVYDVTNVTGTITIGGPPVKVTLGTPGQIANLTFSGTAAQKIRISGTNDTVCATVGVVNPNGSNGGSASECPAGNFSSSHMLSTTGSYTLSIVPTGPATGSMTVQITSP
jgi:YD repeat-containing protein